MLLYVRYVMKGDPLMVRRGGGVYMRGRGIAGVRLRGAAPAMERRDRGMEINTDSELARSALTMYGADALYIPITYMHARGKIREVGHGGCGGCAYSI